ncbi:MAG: hypothetical protein ACK5V3_13265, partial [Bdellovibrionales bacterium]
MKIVRNILLIFLSISAISHAVGSGLVGLKCAEAVKFDEIYSIPINSEMTTDAVIQAKALIQMIENHYGPLTMKKFSIGLNWERAKSDLLSQVKKAESTNDLYYIFHDFMAKFDDAHVSQLIPSTLTWSIPIDFVVIEGQLLFAGAHKDFPKELRKPVLGDKIIGINGKSVSQFQKTFPTWNMAGNKITNLSLFAMQLSNWSESRGLPLSNLNWEGLNFDLVTKSGEKYSLPLKFKKEGIGLIGRDIDLKDPAPPVVQPEVIKSSPLLQSVGIKKTHLVGTQKILTAITKMFQLTWNGHVHLNAKGSSEDSARMQLGSPTPFFKFPSDFTPIKFPLFGFTKNLIGGDSLMAGTFKRNGKTIGLLRIGSYSITNFMAMELAIRRIIGQLNKLKIDTLIIDQTNNPGGYVIFADLLLRSLVGKFDESKHMKFAVKPTQGFLRQYIETRNEIKKNEDGKLTPQQVEEFVARIDIEYNKIYKAFIEGRNLSEPISMLPFSDYFALVLGDHLIEGKITSWLAKKFLGEEVLKPQVFTGEKKLICNELCFSGGDAFPAMVQDYGAAK